MGGYLHPTETTITLSTSTKTFSPKSFVWSPAHLFFLLEKYDSAVRISATSKAVCLFRHPIQKYPFWGFLYGVPTEIRTLTESSTNSSANHYTIGTIKPLLWFSIYTKKSLKNLDPRSYRFFFCLLFTTNP